MKTEMPVVPDERTHGAGMSVVERDPEGLFAEELQSPERIRSRAEAHELPEHGDSVPGQTPPVGYPASVGASDFESAQRRQLFRRAEGLQIENGPVGGRWTALCWPRVGVGHSQLPTGGFLRWKSVTCW